MPSSVFLSLNLNMLYNDNKYHRMVRMKKMLFLITLFILIVPLSAQAQGRLTPLEYGSTTPGEISNVNFEQIYTFEGQADDVVIIELKRSEVATFDPYLYLTTLQNELIASNDDYLNLDSRIVARLPVDGTYQIIATRTGGRTGSGEGAYRLSLNKAQANAINTTIEGRAVPGEASPVHVFIPETAGIYTITYRMVSGNYFPSLKLQQIVENNNYMEEIGLIGGRTLHGGSLTMEFELGIIYVMSVEQSYYTSYDTAGYSALYTIRIEPLEEE